MSNGVPMLRMMADVTAVFKKHYPDRAAYTQGIQQLTARKRMKPKIAREFLKFCLEVYDEYVKTA